MLLEGGIHAACTNNCSRKTALEGKCGISIYESFINVSDKGCYITPWPHHENYWTLAHSHGHCWTSMHRSAQKERGGHVLSDWLKRENTVEFKCPDHMRFPDSASKPLWGCGARDTIKACATGLKFVTLGWTTPSYDKMESKGKGNSLPKHSEAFTYYHPHSHWTRQHPQFSLCTKFAYIKPCFKR